LDENLLGWRTELDLDEKAMNDAVAIVERANIRIQNNERLLPRDVKKENRKTPELEQQNKDSIKLGHWKKALKGIERGRCSNEVRDYLDENLLGWRTELDLDEKAMKDAVAIVERANIRKQNSGNLLPKQITKKNRKTPELQQEHKDSSKLGVWKAIGSSNCSDEVRDYLDEHLPGWRTETDFDEEAMKKAKEIVERANIRKNNNERFLPRKINKENRKTPKLEQEGKDAQKLIMWKLALKGQGTSRCSNEVRDYLDKNLPGWRPIEEENTPPAQTTTEEPKPKPKKKSMKLKTTAKKETSEQKRQRTKTEISELHQRYKTLNSQNLNKEFKEKPELWHKYHEISEENEKSFPKEDIPRNRIIQEIDKIKTTRTKLVVDMGCGKAQIAQHFKNDKRFSFTNYDHVSSNDTVISQDISQIPLEDHSVEICILSLAMWGSNCHDYVKEANRILESGGNLYIMEPTKRWSEQDEQGNIVPEKEGSKMVKLLEENGFQIVEKIIEKFCLFKCIKNN
jgi:ribosomal RNA-processing protein 8